jgi:hypothetical protein
VPELTSVCPGCGLELTSDNHELDSRYHATRACVDLYYELMVFSLSPQDYEFTHQILVDAYAAQHYGPEMKPITITFALIGLYLVFEQGYTGRQAQLAHIKLGKTHREWPRFDAPRQKAVFTVQDVLLGGEKNYRELIGKWGKSVWDIWEAEHEKVASLVNTYLSVENL